MGASSSTASVAAKERRKSTEEGGAALLEADKRTRRLLLQNGLLRSRKSNKAAQAQSGWQKKAHSMYDLQQMRERSADTQKSLEGKKDAGSANNEGGSASGTMTKKQRMRKASAGLTKSLADPAPIAATKSADQIRQASPTLVSAGSPPDPSAMRRRSPTTVATSVAAACQSSSLSSSPSAATTSMTKATRRRPLTWAWIRGHEVSLPEEAAVTSSASSGGGIERRERSSTGRRRSLRSGANDSLASGDASFQRQNSANSPDTSASSCPHVLLGRRSSQAGNPPFAQTGRAKSVRKSDVGIPANPISTSGREIIQFCFDNPHNEIGSRICSRLLEKRIDFRQFAYSMGKERWQQMTGRLKEFLETVVRKVDSIDTVEKLSRKYGEEHVELKCFGFKPDFWVSLADAITVECVILDQATHQPSDTITAWSLLVSIMFSAVRDGYYQAMRAVRISQRHRNVQQRENSFNLSQLNAVEKSSSANELQSPKRKTSGSGNNKYLNHTGETEDKSAKMAPNGMASIEEKSFKVPVQFF